MTKPRQLHDKWDELLHEGTGPVQDEFLELVRRTRDSRHYCANVVWGNLQTADYARAVFQRVVDFHGIPDDVEVGVACRTARAQFIGQGGRTYRTLLGEQALRTNVGGTDVMQGQLTHLLEAVEMPGLKLGVIPARAELDLYPGHSFSIFDGIQVGVETFSAGLNITDKDEVAIYEKAFGLLEHSAVYGQEARDLIEAELNAAS
ncbi:DUF5753 domain-containing protein [Streptomyces sp. ActVer]|uniref:DUF5753 domain-containing protein n=1 Tax=Streptomyces sp. ActVer TaxID=3014558 RepID=UPI0022B359DF|nr:DUF5753 domain-containing protein [Streptomyces sp. ActVer]MCZ4514154.1 DUF5753 domain-containing protein [Streptomyces sp. ActVer]